MTIIARNAKAMTEALHRQGFFLVADLPRRISIQTRRGMLVARIS
ncbi:hypothetical protein [Pseudomonas koreensis]|uniref:Uncharacterized protein n=1 Tax=Pseudomonas koreensis TaxID=198620 RepID=A0AA94ENW7_9PSED|nr:hypothetical protein [Pseudomonas koreensis]RVD77053.1 hypothetical protein A9HBioS_3076 [Pseudomonas koreensis]